MMEAMPAMMGPVMIGPGVVPDNGHGYHAGRQLFGMIKTYEKTRDVTVVARSAAADLDALDQEFFKMETVIPYRYHVRSDGKWVNEGRTLEEISGSGAGEGRVERVIAVQDRMIQDKSITQAAVASEDFGSGRNYLYLFQKKGDKISAYAIEYQGTQGEFRNLLGRLMDKTEGKEQDQKINFTTPLFFKQKSQIQVQDVFAAALHSYENPQRKLEMQPFLVRLARDTDDLPNLIKRQKTRIEEYTQKFKDEILSQPDVVAGLSAGCHAVTTIAEQWIARGRELYTERLGDIGRRSVYETSVATQPVFQQRESISPFSPIVYASTPVQPVSSPDTSLSSVSKQEDKHTENDPPKTTNTSIETNTHYVVETLEPVVPGLIIIISLLSHGEGLSDTSVSQPFSVQEDSFTIDRILFSESDKSSERVTDGGVWQNFLLLLFSSVVQNATDTSFALCHSERSEESLANARNISLRQAQRSLDPPAGGLRDDNRRLKRLTAKLVTDRISSFTFSDEGENVYGQNDLAEREEEESTLFLPDIAQDQVYEAIQSIFTEFGIVLGDSGENGEHIPQEIEAEIVDMAKNILTLLRSRKNSLEDQFLSLYVDKETTAEMKELLTLFLYEEMKTLGNEHAFSVLYEPLFEKRKILVSEILWQLLSTEMHNAGNLTPEFRKKVGILLFLLFILHKNDEDKLCLPVETTEQLKHSVSSAEEGRKVYMSDYLYQMERILLSRQKKNRRGAKTGIIYWFWLNEYYRLISLSLPVVNGVEM